MYVEILALLLLLVLLVLLAAAAISIILRSSSFFIVFADDGKRATSSFSIKRYMLVLRQQCSVVYPRYTCNLYRLHRVCSVTAAACCCCCQCVLFIV